MSSANFDFFDKLDDMSVQQVVETTKIDNLVSIPIYNPSVKDFVNGEYKATLRFIPNFDDFKTPFLPIKKVYIDEPRFDLKGYYYSPTQWGEKRDIIIETSVNLYRNAKDESDSDRRLYLKMNDYFYAYVYVVKDIQKPEFNNKVVLFKFPRTINDLIKKQQKGDDLGTSPCIVYKFLDGKDFKLHLKKKQEYPNYDACTFAEDVSPMKLVINGKQQSYQGTQEQKEFILNLFEECKKTSNFDMLKSEIKEWTPEEKANIEKMCAYFNSKYLGGNGNEFTKPSVTSNFTKPNVKIDNEVEDEFMPKSSVNDDDDFNLDDLSI